MSTRSTLQNAASTVAGQVIARLLALVLYAVLARHMGPDLYGDMGLGMSFGVLFAVMVEPGLNPLLIRDGATNPEGLDDRFADTLGYKLVVLLAAWAAMIGAAAVLGYRGTALGAVIFSGGTTLLVAFEDFGSAVLTARSRMDLEGTLRGTSKLVFTIAGLTAVVLHAPFVGILAALTSAQALTTLVTLALVRRSGVAIRVRFHPERALAQVKTAWPMAVTSVLWLVTLRLDQVLASQMGVQRADLGAYNGAVKLVEAVILFPTAVALTFAPLLAKAFVESRARCVEELQMGLETALSICLPVALGGALLAEPIATAIYGERFVGTGPLLALQLLGLPLVAVQFLTLYTLIAAGALRIQTAIVAVNLTVNVVANLLLVPRLGILGATLSALAGGVAASVVCIAILAREKLRPRLLAASWRPMVCGLLMGALVFAIRDHVPFWAAIVAGGGTYLASFNIFGGARLVSALRNRRVAVSPASPA